MREHQFISFQLKAVSLTEDARWELINLNQVRLITIRREAISFFDNHGHISVSKENHPEAYEAIRFYLLTKLQDGDHIIDEDPEDES